MSFLSAIIKPAIERILIRVARWAADIDRDDWERVLEWVRAAEKLTHLTGPQRKEWVQEHIRTHWKVVAGWALDVVVGMAAGYLGRKGEIHLSK